jgi:hypothetical protein
MILTQRTRSNAAGGKRLAELTPKSQPKVRPRAGRRSAFMMQHAEIMLISLSVFLGNRGLRVSGKMSCVDLEK